MRRHARLALGLALGGAALAGYVLTVGVDEVIRRAAALAPRAVGLVVALVVVEGLADAIGVWASVRPLGDGITAGESVQFALAGDFLDVLSPAGPVSSEPIMAQFISVATDTGYSEALGVRATAKYVKATVQVAVSVALGSLVVLDVPEGETLVLTLGGAVVGLIVVGLAVVGLREPLSRGLGATLGPPVARFSSFYRADPHDRATVTRALDEFWTRVLDFRGSPGLLVLIGVGGALEQVLTATALWVALGGTGTAVVLLPIVVLVPLPQVASVVPVPGSLGAYDVLLSGTMAALTGASLAATATAVLVVRAVALPFGLAAGGVSVGLLRWTGDAGARP